MVVKEEFAETEELVVVVRGSGVDGITVGGSGTGVEVVRSTCGVGTIGGLAGSTAGARTCGGETCEGITCDGITCEDRTCDGVSGGMTCDGG